MNTEYILLRRIAMKFWHFLLIILGSFILAVLFLKGQEQPSAKRTPKIVTEPTKPIITEEIDQKAQQEFEFLARRAKLAGLFNPLYMAISGGLDESRYRQLLYEWETRIERKENTPLAQVWQDLVRKNTEKEWIHDVPAPGFNPVSLKKMALSWYNTLTRWGVVRDQKTSLIVDSSSPDYYDLNWEYQMGDRGEIKLPCWTMNGEVIEKGWAEVYPTQPVQ